MKMTFCCIIVCTMLLIYRLFPIRQSTISSFPPDSLTVHSMNGTMQVFILLSSSFCCRNNKFTLVRVCSELNSNFSCSSGRLASSMCLFLLHFFMVPPSNDQIIVMRTNECCSILIWKRNILGFIIAIAVVDACIVWALNDSK